MGLNFNHKHLLLSSKIIQNFEGKQHTHTEDLLVQDLRGALRTPACLPPEAQGKACPSQVPPSWRWFRCK